MSERLPDEHLNELVARAVLTAKDGGCWVDTETLGRVTNELVDRRVADTKPAPTEQGTLRDEFAMLALAAIIATPDLMGAQSASLRRVEANAQTAYRYADAMLAERAKGAGKP